MIPRSWRLPLGIAGVVFVILQLRITADPIVPYGWDGAEYIEHVTRLEYVALFEGDRSLSPLGVVRELDTEYPPAMHLLTYLLTRMTGHSIEATARLATLWLFLLALAVCVVGRSLAGPRAGLAAGVGILLLPSLGGYATRYYYDIPMTALLWVMVAIVLRTWGRRPWLGGLSSGLLWAAAALTKWTALPFGAAMLVGAAVTGTIRQTQGGERLRQLARSALTFAAAVGGCTILLAGYLSAVGEDSSLTVMLGQMWAQFTPTEAGARDPIGPLALFLAGAQSLSSEASGSKLAFYALSLATSVFSPLLAVAAVLLSLRWVQKSRAGLGLFAATSAGQIGFLLVLVPVADERFLITMTPCLVLTAAVGWASLTRLWRLRTAGLILASALLVALEAHLGIPTLPLTYFDESSPSPLHLGIQVPDRELGRQPYPLKMSTDGLIPSVTLRGLASTRSVEDRGWVPRRDQSHWDPGAADLAWAAVAGLTPSELWIGPAKDKSEAGVLGSFWLSYRSLAAGGPQAFGVAECGAGPTASYAITAVEHDRAPRVEPCMGSSAHWTVSTTFEDPRGRGKVALWVKNRSEGG